MYMMRTPLYVAYILLGGVLEFNAVCQAGTVDCFPHITTDHCPSPVLSCADDPCPSPLTCADGWCSCCQDFANCSGHHGNLTFIPKLPDHIRFVDFSDNTVRSGQLGSQFFTNVTTVTHLSLARMGLKGIRRGVFSLVPNLTCLVLDDNDLSPEDSLPAMMSVPTLSHLSVVNTKLNGFIIEEINSSQVQVLDMQVNDLQEIDLDGICQIKTLKELNLNYCDVRFIHMFFTLGALQRYHLAHNYLNDYFFRDTCTNQVKSRFPYLEYLDLSYNRITRVDEPICLPSLKFLDLSNNQLAVLRKGTFSDTNFPQLHTLVFKSQHRSSPMSIDDTAFNSTTLRDLSLAGNHLDFRSMGPIQQNLFEFCPNLLNMTVDYNDFLAVDVPRFLALFGKLGHLNALSMRNCKIRQVSVAMFSSFTRLVTLHLDDNNIVSIPDATFDALHKLVHLYLSGNQVSTITEDTFGEHIQRQLQVVDLRDNPYLCNCDLLWFKHWLISSPDIFYPHTANTSNNNNYTCHNLPGIRVEDFASNEQPCLLSREMSIQVIISSSLLLTSLSLFSLLFRYRWHIRLVLYQAFRGRDDIRRRRLQADHFDFDIFVSFASEQLPWVLQHLKPQLEDELGLTLCLHERDFIPGKNIVDNIVDCVDSSKKILVLFSRDFVLSQWCQFELVFCLQHVMDVDDALIVVCLDDVTSREMTSVMMAVLKTTTYIQWDDQEEAVQCFWGRLQLALQEILHPAHRV